MCNEQKLKCVLSALVIPPVSCRNTVDVEKNVAKLRMHRVMIISYQLIGILFMGRGAAADAVRLFFCMVFLLWSWWRTGFRINNKKNGQQSEAFIYLIYFIFRYYQQTSSKDVFLWLLWFTTNAQWIGGHKHTEIRKKTCGNGTRSPKLIIDTGIWRPEGEQLLRGIKAGLIAWASQWLFGPRRR